MVIEQDKLLPRWLKDNLDKECSFCGSQYHVGYSPNGLNVTKHYCPNRQCPATIAMKMVFVWTILKVAGIKYGNSMVVIKRNNLKTHLQAIPLVLSEKPTVDLTTFMRLNCIQGIDDGWGRVCKDKCSVDEVLNDRTARGFLTEEDIVDIRNAEQYFNIVIPEKKKYEPVVRMLIMITGDILDLPNREYFVIALNEKYKGLLDLQYSKSPRKTGVTALIKAPTTVTKGKVSIAIENGIPIMTPEEFILFVHKSVVEKVGNNDYDI